MPVSAPFLTEDFAIRWSTLSADHVVSDIRAALESAKTAIENLATHEVEGGVTYENTIEALDAATEPLGNAWGLVSHLNSVRDSEALREAYKEVLPEVTQFFTSIVLNEGLWSRLRAFSETTEAVALAGVQQRYLQETLRDFQENGADLSAEEKSELESVQAELAELTQQYSENVLDSTKAWDLVVEDKSRLAGLPESALNTLQSEAEAKDLCKDGEEPVYRITLNAPSYMPILQFSEDEELRKTVWEASTTIGYAGEFDNTELIWKILSLRQKKAELLGKDNFPDFILQRRMAGNGQTALDFVTDLADKTRPFFEKEWEYLCDFRKKADPAWDGAFNPWDIPFWSEKLRKEEFDFDEEALRPYFQIERVVDGMFSLFSDLFGLEIKERQAVHLPLGSDESIPDGAVEVWHEQVQFYDLYDAESKDHLGSFYADWHPRDEKRGGAWMNSLRTGLPALGDQERIPHLGLICGNLTPSSKDQPALLSHYEVETVFHEFGHLLHHLLGEVPIKSLNGVNVVWDFVELPSQILENFCWSRASLDLFATHYQTGEPIPEALFEKMTAARTFHAGLGQMRQLSLGKLDLSLHLEHHTGSDERDLDAISRQILEGYTIDLPIKPPSMSRRFTHLFASPTGYASGYYSYKWAEVLDADAFSRFEESGVISAAVGREFREKILSKGNSQEAAVLFEDFMGRPASSDALLKRSGLA